MFDRSTTAQGVATGPGVYGQYKLDSSVHKKRHKVGWKGKGNLTEG